MRASRGAPFACREHVNALEGYPWQILVLLKRCVHPDPAQRLSASDFVEVVAEQLEVALNVMRWNASTR